MCYLPVGNSGVKTLNSLSLYDWPPVIKTSPLGSIVASASALGKLMLCKGLI